MKLSQEEIDALNAQEKEQTQKDFQGFKQAMANGDCWICKDRLSSFDNTKPCMHWLLMPKGFKKKHFPLVYQNFTVDRLEAFLRWHATVETPFAGINDLEGETGKVMQVTIKKANLEWSFACGRSCFEGKKHSGVPHYHFQMRVGGQRFIVYAEHHIPLSDYEVWMLNIRLGNNDQFRHVDYHGAGMRAAFEDYEPEDLLEHMRNANDYEAAPFNIQTFVEAEPGTTISGDVLAGLMEESKKTGVPMAKLLRGLKGATVKTIIQPGGGFPEPAVRTPHARGRGKSAREAMGQDQQLS